MDLSTLAISDLIVHELPKKGSGDIVLSDVASPLDTTVRNFFQERIREALSDAGWEVWFKKETASPVPDLVRDQIDRERRDFVDASRKIAQHLYSVQTAVNSGGLLTVARCTIGSPAAKGVAIIKLERESGVRVTAVTLAGGQRTLRVNHVPDLMLTAHTRVFKMGVFFHDTSRRDNVRARVSDPQGPVHGGVATFFLDTFLGCELAQEPQVSTQRFMDVTERFINEEIADASRRTNYHVALLAELTSERKQVSVPQFARNLRAADAARYAKTMSDADVPKQFAKNVTLVATRLASIRFSMDTGTVVLAPSGEIGKSVVVTNLPDGVQRIVVEGVLRATKGSR